MPACGKSTVGVVLAKTMNKDFVDTDITIQQREGHTLQDIINLHGNEYFHRLEERVLLDFDGKDCVVATGGSAIYYPAAIEKFKEKGKVVYINVSLDTILNGSTISKPEESLSKKARLWLISTPKELRCTNRVQISSLTRMVFL